MSKVTTITCDRCNAIVDKANDQSLSVELMVGGSLIKSFPFLARYGDICSQCMTNIELRLKQKLEEV